MGNEKLSVKMFLEVDHNWATIFSSKELQEQIAVRVNNALGFRGK